MLATPTRGAAARLSPSAHSLSADCCLGRGQHCALTDALIEAVAHPVLHRAAWRALDGRNVVPTALALALHRGGVGYSALQAALETAAGLDPGLEEGFGFGAAALLVSVGSVLVKEYIFRVTLKAGEKACRSL